MRGPASTKVKHRGVMSQVQIVDDPDHEGHVIVRLFIDPAPPGIDREAYTIHMRVPKED
jgi:hypothetical protein